MFFQRIRELRTALETDRVKVSNITIDASQTKTGDTDSLSDLDQSTSENESRSIANSTNPSHLYSLPADGDSSINSQTFSLPSTLTQVSGAESIDGPTLDRIAIELNSIAVEWRSYRAPVHCSCTLPFDSLQRKV